MKKITLLILALILCTNFVFSQNGWVQMGYTGPNYITSFYFIDLNNGWFTKSGTDGFTSKGDIGKTIDGGLNWSVSMIGNVAFQDVHYINTNTGWVIGNFGNDVGQSSRKIYKTTNAGNNYIVQHTDTLPSGVFNKIFSANENYIWSISNSQVIKSSNSGLNWSQQSLSGPLTDIFFINENTGWILATLNRIFKTSNKGDNWTQLPLPSGNSQECMHFINDATGWVCNENLYKTINGGLNWNLVSAIGITARSVFFISENQGWICGNNGTIKNTSNGGSNWITQISGGSYATFQLNTIQFINPSTGWCMGSALLMYPNYLGLILKTTNGGITGFNNISSEIPKSFSLCQNYPNPFNPTTNIKFDIPKQSFVKLVIYDMLGREVATLVNEQLKAGTYQADWNAPAFPSGVYFYKLQTESYTETKKMVLIK